MGKRTSLVLLPAACIVALQIHQASAATYNVVPDDDSASSSDTEVYSLSDALKIAEAGDSIVLGDGSYTDQLHSVTSGEEGNPITVTGTRNAVIRASLDMVLINHSWITLEGFSVDGVADDSNDYDNYTNKCVVIDGKAESEEDALQGFIMRDMLVQNCGGECVRLKNFVVNSEITGNDIYHCGIYDFEGDGEDVNGEGIYIGTSYTQWDDYGADSCNGNWVADNTIATFGNECVEVKEGSSYNIVEYNTCSDQLDDQSGCFCSRGDENIFRYNDARDCEGAGIRLGGWEDSDGYEHGQNNDVYDNSFVNTAAGGMSVRVVPQNEICGNTCEEGTCDIVKDEGEDEDTSDIEASWDVLCGGTLGTPSPVVDTPSPVEPTPSPSSETPSPARDTPSPTEETPAPSTFSPSPVMETPSPIGDTPSPVDETPSPVSHTRSPISVMPSSTADTPSPVFETPSPVNDDDNENDDDDDANDDYQSDDEDDDNDENEDDDDDDDDDDDNDEDDTTDDYQSDDEGNGDDDGNDDYESDDEDDGNDDYQSDDEDDTNDDYQSDDNDTNDDYQSDDGDDGDDDNDDSGNDDERDDDTTGGDDGSDDNSGADDHTDGPGGRWRGGRD